MDMCHLERMEMDDALEDLACAVSVQKELTAAKALIGKLRARIERQQAQLTEADALTGKLSEEHDARIRAEERLSMALQGIDVGRMVEASLRGSYTFKSLKNTEPLDVEAHDAFAVTLVAVAGHDRDWACYAGQTGLRPAEIADHGNKVSLVCAGIFAAVMQHRYYRSE